MSEWYYTDAMAVRYGPFQETDLASLARQGIVLAKTNVWSEGMPGWAPFKKVAGRVFAGESTAEDEVTPPVLVGVCFESDQVYPLDELLPYGEVLVSPDYKDEFVQQVMESAVTGVKSLDLVYVGFWWRVLGALVDYMVKMIPSWIFMIPYYAVAFKQSISPSTTEDSPANGDAFSTALIIGYLIGILANMLFSIGYDTWMVGRYQATLGKMAIGAKVVNPDGSRLSYWRAFFRWLAKKPLNSLLAWGPVTVGFAAMAGFIGFLSAYQGDDGILLVFGIIFGMILNLILVVLGMGVYWMAAFDPEKRALHDRVASTRVIKK